MLFNSYEFLVFFPVVVATYYALPSRWRWALLLVASYVFYAAWRIEYLILIVASTGVDYFAGIRMGRATDRKGRRPWLILSLIVNLGILFAFKYANFFGESFQAVLDFADLARDVPTLSVLLPVGISFYTFQTLSYTIDVYRGERPPEHHLGYFALYVSFFPQLVAGPIERSTHLLPQLRTTHRLSYDNVTWGLTKMSYGFFKKMVVADRLGLYVDAVYGNPAGATSVSVVLATFFFAFQIYCDFSGYTDIAVGAARTMGVDLMENFRRPYLSRSIREFWSRWHVSLSTWFRDYLYIPLGGNRVVRWRWYTNIFVVFVVSGLWHGAAWTFIIWGAFHGAYLVAGLATARIRDRLWGLAGADSLAVIIGRGHPRSKEAREMGNRAGSKEASTPDRQPSTAPAADRTLSGVTALRSILAMALTFILVLIGWVFFRAESLTHALHFIGLVIRFDASVSAIQLFAGLGPLKFLLNFVVIGILLLTYRLPINMRIRRRRLFVFVMVLLIVVLGVDTGQQFIYFQF